jgi:hypothetical protein
VQVDTARRVTTTKPQVKTTWGFDMNSRELMVEKGTSGGADAPSASIAVSCQPPGDSRAFAWAMVMWRLVL